MFITITMVGKWNSEQFSNSNLLVHYTISIYSIHTHDTPN